MLLSGSNITDPDRVIIANWKRLNDATWNFEVNQSRDFNLLPYSINDSAIAVYYEPETVPSGTVKSVAFKLNWRKADVVYTAAESERNTGVASVNRELVDSILDEVVAIDTLLQQIDSLLSSGSQPTEDALNEIRKALSELEDRRKEFSEQQ